MATPKPKAEEERQSLLWLWLLMFVVAGGVGALLLFSEPAPIVQPVVAKATPTPTPTPTIEPTPTPTPEAPPPSPTSVANIDVGGLHTPPPPPTVEPRPSPKNITKASAVVTKTIPMPSVSPIEPAPSAKPAPQIPLPELTADVRPAIETLRKCPTMQSCIQGADATLGMFGNTARLPDPGVASLANFEAVSNNYRRAQAEALKVAKELAARPNGNKVEVELRATFEAIPKLDAWVIADNELRPIRVAIERLVARWTAEHRIAPENTLGMQVRLLTPAGGRDLEIGFEHEASSFAGLTDLKDFLRKELANAKELRSSERQRLATVKVVVSPAGHHVVD